MPDRHIVFDLSTLDQETPVAYVGDTRHNGRDALVLFSDVSRETLAWMLEQAELRHELLLVRDQRRRWTDSVMARVAAGLGVCVLLTDLGLNIVNLIQHAH